MKMSSVPKPPNRCWGRCWIAAQEHHREQIEVAAHVALPPVLGAAGRAAAVAHLDLGDLEAGLGGDHGDVAMELPVDRDGLDDLAPVGLEAAVEVVQRDPGRLAHGPVEEARRQRLVERILAPLFPAGYQVEALRERRREIGDLGRIVLTVAIHGDDVVTAGGGEPVRQRRRLAEVAPQLDDAHVVPGFGEPLHDRERAVRGPIVHEDDLVRAAERRKRLVDLGDERLEAVRLVVHGDHE